MKNSPQDKIKIPFGHGFLSRFNPIPDRNWVTQIIIEKGESSKYRLHTDELTTLDGWPGAQLV